MELTVDTINDISKLESNIDLFYRMSSSMKLHILEDLRKNHTEECGRFLVAVYPREEDRKIQKAIRKSLFVLKTAGVKVEELPSTPQESVLKRVEEERAHKGFISNFDSEGTRLMLAFIEKKKNSFVVIEAISHLFDGLLELMTLPATKVEAEKILAEYRAKTTPSIHLAEVSPSYAFYLLAEEAGRSGKYADEARKLKQFSAYARGEVCQPSDIHSLPVPEGTRPLDMVATLESSIFVPLDLAWDGIEEDRRAYQDTGTGTLVLPPHMVEEKRNSFVSSFLQSEKGRSVEARVVRILEDYAYMLFAEREYGAFSGLVELLREPGAVSGPVAFLLKKAFEKTEARTPGLIVSPYEQQVRP